MSSLAAVLLDMSSLYSAFSAFRCSVASATAVSKDLMPASRALISSVVVSMPSLASAITVDKSSIDRCSSFCLSSAVSNCLAQYSFLSSSSVCSFFSVPTSSSTSWMTFSKPTLRPRKASEMKSKPRRPAPRGARARAAAKSSLACERIEAAVTCTCMKLSPGLGKVFLNKSSASSSLRILTVSANATISWARVFFSSSWIFSFSSQFFSRSAAKALSCSRPSAVSSTSFFISAMRMPTSDDRASFSSIVFDNAATSFFLAAMRLSCSLTAASSVATKSC
mmetsp:Transcript_95563/g.275332  ORF Transcript_95563/g.275332 Transcript_95563/m.275332 type:complete len:280 (+) Transcript_95563:802-1641(+)